MISNELLLLKIINFNGRISLLRDRGLSHSQIAMMISKQAEKGNISITKDEILLTDTGREALRQGLSDNNLNKKSQWILPKEHLYNKPISFNEIVLPKSKNI